MEMRKNYLVKKKFQLKFLSGFLILILLESVLIGGLFMHISSDTLTTGYFDSVLTVETTPDFFFMPLLFIIGIVVVGIGIAGMIVFILLSHRIAGPLYRFEKILNQMEGGDLTTRVDLRKTDQLMELKEALNALIGSLDKRVGSMRSHLEKVSSILSRKDDPEFPARLEAAIGILKDELEHFKVTSSEE